MSTALQLAAVIVLIGANAFFVASEFSMLAADRRELEDEAEGGKGWARASLRMVRGLSSHLSAAQLGITLAAVGLGFMAKPTIGRLIQPATERVFGASGAEGGAVLVGLALLVATVSQMLFGELLPKSIAITRPIATLRTVARGMTGFARLVSPFVRLFNGVANLMLRRFGIEPREELATTRTLDELRVMIRSSASEGMLDEEAHTLLERSIRFGDKTALDALIPRVSVEWLPDTADVNALIMACDRTGFSRFPVVGGDLDNVVGVVHVKSVYTLPPSERSATLVTELMREPFLVPVTRELESLLVDLRERRDSLAILIDEHGGTAGIITTEDLVEEIVGEIDDEHDGDRVIEATVEQNELGFELSGALHGDEVFEACRFQMPEGDYETLAGFVIDRLDRIPDVGDGFDYHGWAFTVVERDRLRVSRLSLIPPMTWDADGTTAGGNGVEVARAAGTKTSGVDR